MTKIRKQEIFFYVAVVVLFTFVGLNVWLRTGEELSAGARQLIVAAQFALAAAFLVLLFVSFRR